MNTNESDLLFTGKESDKKYWSTWTSEGERSTIKVVNRATGKQAEATTKGSIFKLHAKLIDALEKDDAK